MSYLKAFKINEDALTMDPDIISRHCVKEDGSLPPYDTYGWVHSVEKARAKIMEKQVARRKRLRNLLIWEQAAMIEYRKLCQIDLQVEYDIKNPFKILK